MKEIYFEKDGLIYSSRHEDIKTDQVLAWLNQRSYWAQDLSEEKLIQSLRHSFCLSLLEGERQIGFGRLITDYAVFAYLADIFILEEYQGKGLGTQMIKTFLELPWIKDMRKIMLATLDAQSFYARLGFKPLLVPDRYMEINRSCLREPGAQDKAEPQD